MASSTSPTKKAPAKKAPAAAGDRRAAINNLTQDYCKFLVHYYFKTLVVVPSQQPYGCWIPNKLPSQKDGGYIKISLKKDDYERALGMASPQQSKTRSQKRNEQTVKELFKDDNKTTEKNVYLHVISYKATHGTCPDGVHMQVSHLCHIPACFNPDHLVSEATHINNQRKNCTRALLLPSNVDQESIRIVVRTCTGHGTTNLCIMPIIYNDNKHYKVVNPDTTTPVPETVFGGGGHASVTRKNSWGDWERKKRREQLQVQVQVEEEEEEEENEGGFVDDDDAFESPQERKKPKISYINKGDDNDDNDVVDKSPPRVSPPRAAPSREENQRNPKRPYWLAMQDDEEEEDPDEVTKELLSLASRSPSPRKRPKTS